MKKDFVASTVAVLRRKKDPEQKSGPICPYCGRDLDQLNWIKSDVGEEYPLTIIFCPYSDCRKILTTHF